MFGALSGLQCSEYTSTRKVKNVCGKVQWVMLKDLVGGFPQSFSVFSLPHRESSQCMVLACSGKEEPPAKRSGKPLLWGGRNGGVKVTEFWPHWLWGVFCYGNSIHHMLQYGFVTYISETLLVSAYRPDYTFWTLFLLRCSSSYSSLLSKMLKKLKTEWKHSCYRKRTPSYHMATPTFSKECNGCILKGEKAACPAMHRLTSHYVGFLKTAKWREPHGGGWYGKWGEALLILKGEKKKNKIGQKASHKC